MLETVPGYGFVALLLSALLAAAPSPPPKVASLTTDQAIKRWADGPVRYLMTTQEYDAVREIKTVPELAQFITKFWARRDPSPGTFENEYRRTYWARVVEANKRFRDSTIPGWKTDRGKVFILLGAPDDVQGEQSPKGPSAIGGVSQSQIADSDLRGLERWTYRRRYSKTADPEFVVAFVRNASLDWELTTDASLLQPEFPGSSTSGAGDAAFGGIENDAGSRASVAPSSGPGGAASPAPPALDTSTLANYDLGLEMAAVPTNAETIIATVSAHEFLSAFKATARFECFRSQDGSTFVNIGALVVAKDLYQDLTSGVSMLRVYASITPSKEGVASRYSTNENQPARFNLKAGPDPGGLVETWTGIALPPGRYHVTLAVEDSLSGRLGRASGEFDAPDFSSSQLAMSTLVLASALSDTDGKLGVAAPRSSATFARSESFCLYFEVYGLKEAASPFEVSYQFYRDTGGAATPIGKPVVFADRTQAAQGWSVPLAKWPPGRYRIEVTVTDPSGQSVSTLAPFEVVNSLSALALRAGVIRRG